MRWLRFQLGMLISLFSAYSFSHVVTFYGFESIEHYHGRSNGEYYIQLASFSASLNAYHYQSKMQAKISQPVKIERKGGSYVIVVGPLKSMAAVRKVANQANSKFVPTQTEQPANLRAGRIKAQQTTTSMAPEKEPFTQRLVEQFPLLYENWYLTAGGGMQWNILPKTVRMAENTQGLAGAALGYRWEFNNPWVPAFMLGLRYFTVTSRNIGGAFSPSSTEVSSNVGLAMTKLNLFQYSLFSLYLDGGLGLAFNRAKGNSETPAAQATLGVNPNFVDRTSTHFAYTLGAGLDLLLANRFIVSGGYAYQDLGSVSSVLSAYRSNAVFLSVSYLFGDR